MIALTMALAMTAAGSGLVYADTIEAGTTRQTQTGGPGATPAANVQIVPAVSGEAQNVAPGGSSQTTLTQDVNLSVVSTEQSVTPAAGTVTVNAEYGQNGEILRYALSLNGVNGTITYGGRVNTSNYIPWAADGAFLGGTEDSTHVEAIQVALTGEAGKLYDVYYRGVSAIAGQHGWACNEELMGTIDRGDYLKSIEVVLVPKGAGAPGSYQGRFYSNHSEYITISSDGSTYANGYTGWVDHDRARYYFLNGQALTGWQYVDGLKYFFNDSGAMIMDVSDMIGKQDSYVIKVNKELNCATVYAKDGDNGYIIPVKAMLTSVGDDTPLGTFYTPEKYRWRLMVNDTYTQYATRITEGFLFHSITYEKTNEKTLLTNGYNRLGVTRSLGCVRLNAGNAKWVYDNCKLGTEVVVYEDAQTPSPFFKPYQKWIPADQTWDPTDPNCADL
jgi:hypothetical protein